MDGRQLKAKILFNEIYLNRFAITEIGGKLYEFDGNGACQSEIKKKIVGISRPMEHGTGLMKMEL